MGFNWFSRIIDFILRSRRSSVAAIVSPNGDIRVVVTQRWRMKFHLGEGEKLYVVPNLLVKEPISWDSVSNIIELAQSQIK